MQEYDVRDTGNLGDFQLGTRIRDVTDDAVQPGVAEGDDGRNGRIPAWGNPAFKPECRLTGDKGRKIAHPPS